MLHIHFGTGRLGLGLVAPFFQTPGSELYLLNRSVSGTKATGSTALTSERRNQLLQDHPGRFYVLHELGGAEAKRHIVHYDGFYTYDDENAEDTVKFIIKASKQRQRGVVVTASVLKAENYGAVVQILNVLADLRKQQQVGPLFLVACENTLSASDVLTHPELSEMISENVRRHVVCVHALVDRMCVELEEDQEDNSPTVLVKVEQYGSLKLELSAEADDLLQLLDGSRVEFSRHVAVEKQIKNWLLNGTHWLIALSAFEESNANRDLKLNEFLSARVERREFAGLVMQEMRDGVAALLRNQPEYADFAADVDVDQYLQAASEAILARFITNEDPIARILARFQAPSAESLTSIQSFSKRFGDRVDEPISAYEADTGAAPVGAMHSMHSLVRLIASGSFINTTQA